MVGRACEYCGNPVDGDVAYRDHLRRKHEAAELTRIDRAAARTAAPKQPAPSSRPPKQRVPRFRLPLPRDEVARLALYAALASAVVALVIGASS